MNQMKYNVSGGGDQWPVTFGDLAANGQLREGMFRMPDRSSCGRFLRDRCRNCGESFFPPRVFARCHPERGKRRIARRAKSTRSTIVGSSSPISDGSALRLVRFEVGAQPFQRDGN